MSDISSQINLNSLQVNAQILGGLGSLNAFNKNNSNNTTGIQSISLTNNKQIYASKGEYKYNEDMDTDSDGVVTFNEYVKYISEQSFSGNNNFKSLYNLTKYTKTTDADTGLQLLNISNLGKALRTYINSSVKLPKSIISAEG